MKNNIIGLFLLLCTLNIQLVSAQRHYRPEISVGVKFGTNLSNTTFQPKVQEGLLLGYMGGLSFRYIEEKHFGFIVEANFSQQGWKEDFENEPYQFSRKMNYIQIPFMSHIFFGNKFFRGFVNLGPQVGFFISDSYKSNCDINNPPTFTSSSRETQQYTMPIANKVDYGITAGAGLEFRILRSSFLLESRYYFGLGDFFKNRKKDYFATSSNKNILIALSYMFRVR